MAAKRGEKFLLCSTRNAVVDALVDGGLDVAVALADGDDGVYVRGRVVADAEAFEGVAACVRATLSVTGVVTAILPHSPLVQLIHRLERLLEQRLWVWTMKIEYINLLDAQRFKGLACARLYAVSTQRASGLRGIADDLGMNGKALASIDLAEEVLRLAGAIDARRIDCSHAAVLARCVEEGTHSVCLADGSGSDERVAAHHANDCLDHVVRGDKIGTMQDMLPARHSYAIVRNDGEASSYPDKMTIARADLIDGVEAIQGPSLIG